MNENNSRLTELYDQVEMESQSESLFESLMNTDLRYLRLSQVGTGAMKEVFRTEDRKSGRIVAMARLKNYEDPKAIESFLREARINARLQHPHIVPVYEINIDEQQQPFFTMKLIPGSSLKQLIETLRSGDEEAKKLYPLPVLLDIFLKVCDAIAYAHSMGICHLDIKPDNIRTSKFGEVMVCDWGLANLTGEEEEIEDFDEKLKHYESNFMTLTGQIKGTPGYMAPEQATGKCEKKDQRTDIFALGCILYELLTLQPAIEGKDVKQVIKNTCNATVKSPSLRFPHLNIDAGLDAVCLKALQKDPEERYQKVDEIIAEIEAYRNGFATQAESPSFVKQLVLFYKRNKAICLTVSLAIVIIISGTITFIDNIRNKEQIALKALDEVTKQKNIIKDTLAEVQELQSFKAGSYAKLAGQAISKENYEQGFEYASIAFGFDKKNYLAQSILMKCYLAQGNFQKALQYFNLINKENISNKDNLLNFVKDLNQSQINTADLNYQQLYFLCKKHLGINSMRIRNKMLSHYLSPSEKLDESKRELLWLLKQDNGLKKLNFELSEKDSKLYVDLSNNPKLNNIYILETIPVYELKLSNSGIKKSKSIIHANPMILHIDSTNIRNLDFLRYFQKIDSLYISKNAFSSKEIRLHSKKVKIIEKEN